MFSAGKGFFSVAAKTATSVFRQAEAGPSKLQSRSLNIHEYQSYGILEKYGVRVPKGRVAFSVEEAEKAVQEVGTTNVVVKAQVLAGGRGLGRFANGFQGGVHTASSVAEVKDLASKMIGQNLITKQTDAQGKPCNKIFVVERVNVKRELYFAILMDRSFGGPVLVASTQGGVNIEEVAKHNPEAICKEAVDIMQGPNRAQTLKLAEKLGFSGKTAEDAAEQFERLYELFIKTDATQVEINPFAELADGRVVCADAKINFDENASFRHADIFAMNDPSGDDPREVQAAKFNLNYIGLNGNIGCMVNGAGLAMATMDIIKLYGGLPANFLDVGGGATTEQVTEAFKLLTSDPQVKAILVNIFGGIMRCDVIAQGIITAASEVGLKIPLIVRLAGTNVDLGVKMLKESGLPILTAGDLDQAAQVAVASLKQ